MDTNINTKGKGLWTKFVGWLNTLMNPNHAWIDYASRPNSALGDVVELLSDDLPNQVTNLVNRYTDAHATQGEVERNEMQMQNIEDTYQRQVTGMQNAGLNPALMYQNGASSSAPSVNTSGSGSGLNMSDLMNLLLIKDQKNLMQAQAENLRASANRNEKQAEKLGVEIGLVESKIKNSNLDVESKSISLEYQRRFADADLRIKEMSADKLGAEYDSLMKSIEKMDYDELLSFGRYLETIENISVLEKSKELTSAQISELSALTKKLQAEEKLIGKEFENFDYIHAFVTNESLGIGTSGVRGSASGVVTLDDIKRGVRNNIENLGNRGKHPHYSNSR